MRKHVAAVVSRLRFSQAQRLDSLCRSGSAATGCLTNIMSRQSRSDKQSLTAGTRMNFFNTFDVPVAFTVDTALLSARYRDLQTVVHPDRFVNATETEKRAAMGRSVDINEAYNTLKDPVRRAMHLLSLVSIDGLDEKNTTMPADFLMEQIDWREALADAHLKEDEDRLEEMSSELASTLASLGDTFDAAYRGEHTSVATTLARKMRFVQKLSEEVDSALADWEQ